MIARIWRGSVASSDADAYADYMMATGVPGYADTPGNRGVYMLRRETGDTCEFLMFSLWDSMEAVRAFAGDDPERAVFYSEDDRFLVDRELTVQHWQVHNGSTATGDSQG
jgi:heme-degrading monooxygenase HmoA